MKNNNKEQLPLVVSSPLSHDAFLLLLQLIGTQHKKDAAKGKHKEITPDPV